MTAIWKREMANYYYTPIGYIFMGVFWLIGGVFFMIYNLFGASGNLAGMFGNLSYLFMLVMPLLTMRLLSEERRTRTDQLLLTSPISVTAVVVGKFLAACSVFFFSLAGTGVYVVVIAMYSRAAAGMIIANYLGFFLMGCCYIAIGVLMSALTESQLSAAVLTFGANLLLQFLESIGPSLNVPHMKWLSRVFSWLSFYGRSNEFYAGLISTANVLYCLSFCGILLFVTIQVIDRRRWSEG